MEILLCIPKIIRLSVGRTLQKLPPTTLPPHTTHAVETYDSSRHCKNSSIVFTYGSDRAE
jgi:hypothetical protein